LRNVKVKSATPAGQLVELRDGTKALIRPIRADDRERLREGFEGASEEAIFRRFLSPHPRLTSTELDYLTGVDHVRHEALIAVDPETQESFGTARYVRDEDDPGTAEFAVGVGDRWMGIGLGTALLSALVRRAREAGVTRLTGVIHPENMAIRRLMARVLGAYETTSVEQGAIGVAADLTKPETGRRG
jgi:RimJ/RimL family protein N-acetyltransferase